MSYAMLRYLFHDDVVTTDEYYATGAAFTVVAHIAMVVSRMVRLTMMRRRR